MGYKILSKKEICPNQYEITIDAPYVVRNAKAGQFIIFRAEQDGERVPLTIADCDKEKGHLTLVFMAVGYSTKKLAALNEGDEGMLMVGNVVANRVLADCLTFKNINIYFSKD